VAKKKQSRRNFTAEFKRRAVERMRECESVVGLARELRINWRLLYRWKEELEAPGGAEAEQLGQREKQLLEENARLKAALADQVLQTSFFKGALQKIEAQRQNKSGSGRLASTSSCGK
jgi:transposase-like protein